MITFGTDPEFMLKTKAGALKSAIGVVPGTKENRFDLKDGAACYYDNVLCEFQVPASKTKNEAVDNIRQTLSKGAKLVAPLRLTVQASAEYPKAELQHEDALKFGCDPEFCAYEMCVIDPPDAATQNFRSSGGHIHIGYDGGADIVDSDPIKCEELNLAVMMNRLWIARMCDIVIGIPSLFLDKDPTSKNRRKLYGRAGSHRVCPNYGVEYRSCSNFWLSRPSLVELMFDLATVAHDLVMNKKRHEEIWETRIQPETLKTTINEWDMEKAKGFLKVTNSLLPAKVQKTLEKEIGKDWNDDLYTQWGIKI